MLTHCLCFTTKTIVTAFVRLNTPVVIGDFSEEEFASLECINVRNLEHNNEFIWERRARILVIQEHNMAEQNIPKVKGEFDKKGWGLQCGPCDSSTEKPGAGVAVAVKGR